MNLITSRKNEYIRLLRQLGSDGAARRARGEYICDGVKTLKEALAAGAEVSSVLWREEAQTIDGLSCAAQYAAPGELFDYAAPIKSGPGPLFTVRMPRGADAARINNAIVLETVQDPGNVGTVIRTANAFGIDAVILVGACADLYSPKTVRATMGAIFRQRVISCHAEELMPLLERSMLPLYGAALSARAQDVRGVDISHAAVAIGSEGQGLSAALLSMCESELIIPMQACSESLNAGVAAAVIMWEMARGACVPEA